MSEFNYSAITADGKRIKGVRESETKEDVVNYLTTNNLTVISVDEKIGVSLNKLVNIEIGGYPLAEKVVLVKQLSTMISAGIPLIQCIDILAQQAEKDSIKTKLENVYKMIESGITLSEAFRREEGIFSEVQLNLIAAGEKSGNLSEMLQKVSEDLDKSKNLRGKIVGAMIYPAIIFTIMFVVLIIMITFMVPQIKILYSSLGQDELPLVTQILVTIGEILGRPVSLLLTILTVVMIFVIYKYVNSTKAGKILVDRLKLKVPVFGKLITKIELAEFCRILSMLLKSGIPIIDAINIVSRALGNKVFIDAVSSSVDGIKKGESLSLSLAKHNTYGAIPLVLLKIIATGEEAGKLDKVLQDMSEFYDNEVEQITNNLTKLLEPFILVIAGVMVGFLAVAVYLPIYSILGKIQ